MARAYPPELQAFVEQELATGNYQSEHELLVEAVRMLRELKARHHQLRADLQIAISQAEQGQIISLDTEATKKEGRLRLNNRT